MTIVVILLFLILLCLLPKSIWQGLGWLIAVVFILCVLGDAHTPRWVHGSWGDVWEAIKGLFVLIAFVAGVLGIKYLDEKK